MDLGFRTHLLSITNDFEMTIFDNLNKNKSSKRFEIFEIQQQHNEIFQQFKKSKIQEPTRQCKRQGGRRSQVWGRGGEGTGVRGEEELS